MRSFLVGVLLATVVLFVWGFLVWGLMPLNPFAHAADEPALARQLLEAMPTTGVYLLPAENPEHFEASLAAMREGPLAMVFFRREGVNPMAPSIFILGFLHMLVTVLLAALGLRTATPSLPRYGQRVALVSVFGLASAVWANLGEPIWWHQPWGFHGLAFVYDALGWMLVALVLARFVQRRAPSLVSA